MPKRNVQAILPTINVDGKNRTLDAHKDVTSREKALERLTPTDKYRYYRINEHKLSPADMLNMYDVRNSMARYAEEYGTQAQADEISTWDLNRLKWLIEHDIINLEEYFEYDEGNIDSRGAKIPGSKTVHIQETIDDYHRLYVEGRAERQRRRRAGGWS